MIRSLIFALLLTASAFAPRAFAAGGACPTGANYIDLTNPSNGGGLGSVTLASLGVTQCYYVSAAGLDSNSGTSESTPWLHAPGMANFTGSYTFAAGDGIIFRGGDTWHRSSGSPLTGAWILTHSGTSANPVYQGIDVTWFSGASFARPIFSQDNALSTGTVGSCSFADDGTTFLSAGSTSFNIVDGLEFTGNCQSGSGVGSIISPISATSFVSERLYMHGWTSTAGVGDDAGVKIGTNGNSTSNHSNRHLFDVIDGADSTFGASCNTPSCVTSGTASGWAFGDGYDVEYSVIRHVSNGIQAGNICTLIGNLMEYEFEPSLPGGRHGNVVEENFGSACTTALFYNNITQNTNEGVNWWPGGGTYYIFNNIWINSGHVFGSPAIDPNGLMLSGLGTTGFTTVHANLYNNTFQSNKVQAPAENGTTPGWAAGSTITWENNHIMDFTNTPSFFSCGSGNTCAATENGGEVFQTTSAAEGQGYSFANSWTPTAGTNATVGAGNNTTSFCAGLPNALAIAACESGSPKAVSEVSGWGGLLASYPAATSNVRNVSAWDAGAYQFLAALSPCGPPAYSCASTSTANPGLITAPFVSTQPAGVVNVSTTTVGACSPTASQDCMSWVSGDQFVTTWAHGNGPGSGGNVSVFNGIANQNCEVVAWNSTTLATILCSPQIATITSVAWFNFTACKGISSNGTGNGCQNSVGYDLTIPGVPSGSFPITRLSDGGSTDNAGRPVGNLTRSSAGSTDIVSLAFNGGLDHYAAVQLSGGTNAIYHIRQVGGSTPYLQVVNTGQSALTATGTIIFSHIHYNQFRQIGNIGTYGTGVNLCTITSDTAMSCVLERDFFAGGGSSGGPACPGVTPFSVVSGPGISGLTSNDDEIGAVWSAGVQNTGYLVFDYSLSAKGGGSPSCSTSNLVTGQVWNFCTTSCNSGTTPLTNPLTGLQTFLGNVSTTTTNTLTGGSSQTITVNCGGSTGANQLYVGMPIVLDTSGSGVQETVTLTAVGSCSTTQNLTGFVVNSHSSSAPVVFVAPTCWGAPGGSNMSNLHDENFGWGGYMHYGIESNATSWTNGICAIVSNSNQEMIWQPGTYNQTYMSSNGTYYYGVTHDSMGVANQVGVNFNGSVIRPYLSPTTPTFISAALPNQDSHTSGWPHLCPGTGFTPNDTCLWISAADSVLTSQGSAGTGNCPGGTSAVYCPNYLSNVFFGLNPFGSPTQTPLVLLHTFSCNPAGGSFAHCLPAFTGDPGNDVFGPGSSISAESSDGTIVCWVSSMLHQEGVDNSGTAARADVYCALLTNQVFPSGIQPAPATALFATVSQTKSPHSIGGTQ